MRKSLQLGKFKTIQDVSREAWGMLSRWPSPCSNSPTFLLIVSKEIQHSHARPIRTTACDSRKTPHRIHILSVFVIFTVAVGSLSYIPIVVHKLCSICIQNCCPNFFLSISLYRSKWANQKHKYVLPYISIRERSMRISMWHRWLTHTTHDPIDSVLTIVCLTHPAPAYQSILNISETIKPSRTIADPALPSIEKNHGNLHTDHMRIAVWPNYGNVTPKGSYE